MPSKRIDKRFVDCDKAVMSLSRIDKFVNAGTAKRTAILAILAAIAIFVIRSAVIAIKQAIHYDDFPESLAVKVELMPVIFPLHMVTGGLALLLVPLAILLRKQRRWHRLAGRIAACDILLAGITAIPVALVAPVTPWSAAGFTAQGCIWLALLGFGLWNIRCHREAAHRACMLMLAATTSGAIFFRIYLALWAIFAQGRYFELFYACDAWVAWALPLTITAFLLRRNDRWLSHSG